MQKHTYRTLLIYAVIVVAAINIYPTVGWMAISEETRQAKLEQWTEEDLANERPGFFADMGRSVRRWAQFDRARVINLGLDLQGGIHMVLGFDVTPGGMDIKIDDPGYIAVRTPQGESYAKDEFYQVEVDGRVTTADDFEVLGIDNEPIIVLGDSIKVDDNGQITQAGTVKGQIKVVEFGDRTGLTPLGDIEGLVYMASASALATLQPATAPHLDVTVYPRENPIQDIILNTIQMRINEFEAKEPIIQKLGTSQVQIQLPGEKNIQRAKNLIMKMAVLNFHMVSGPDETETALLDVDRHFENKFLPVLDASTWPSVQVAVANFDRVKRMIDEVNETDGVLPEGKMFAFSPPPKPWDEVQVHVLYLMSAEAEMSGEGLKSASARPDESRPGGWQILFEFGAGAAHEFAEVTEQNIGKRMAIVLDGHVVSAPNINERIFGSGQITGSFSAEEAQDLSISLNSGSMLVPIREDYTGVVGASLGADSVRSGVKSSLIGFAMVLVFMVIYYRVGGLVANVALAVNALLVLGALAYFDATLTLPGIAGMVLTIGMAVDANVLIFERIREELRNGKSLASAIEGGYARATVTILDANITTLIAAAVLTQFGTGPVQGFAVTLSIGVCASVFAALVVTRALLEFLTEHKLIDNLMMMSIIKDKPAFKFMAKRRAAAILSTVVIGVGIIIFAMRGQANFGVDFTNGTNIDLALNADGAIPVGAVRDSLTAAGFDSPTVQTAQGQDAATPNRFLIRIADEGEQPTQTAEEEDVTVSTRVQRALLPLCTDPTAANVDEQVNLLKVEFVGPAVGAQLQKDALAAITYALIFIVAYLWFRFELRFAVGAVVALIHDVLITVGIFSLLGRELTIPVVAALLTIIGYSLNDTIVVFDRIREDTRLYRSRGMTFLEILDASINQTLSRTILTSVTTLFVVLILLIFGGSAIEDFALALTIGIVVGTYSSIFVASPVVHLWQQLRGRFTGSDAGGRGRGSKDSAKRKKRSADSGKATA